MSLSLELSAALNPLTGMTFVPPKTVTVSDGSGVSIGVDLLSVETLGISCEELRLDIPTLNVNTIDTLKNWANDLCRRVTYLLENLGPLEFDAHGNQVLIRSTQVDKSAPGTTKYYEVMLSAHGAGRFSLRRYRNDNSGNAREAVPLQLTHELLSKLVNDLVLTIPGKP